MSGAQAGEAGAAQQLQHLVSSLEELCRDVEAFRRDRPLVQGSARLLRRAQRELAAATRLAAAHDGAAAAGAAAPSRTEAADACADEDEGAAAATRTCSFAGRVTGVRNNLAGLTAELQVAAAAPGVVALNHKFSSLPEEGACAAETAQRVEVDVVAANGHTWVEVKAVADFSTGSSWWHGREGHTKGVQQQARELLAVAAAPCNARRWRAPAVVLHFPGGVDREVERRLRADGAHVTKGDIASAALPPPPPPPQVANLDVTTLCALVSQAAHADPGDAAVTRWAQRISHWRESVAAEAAGPRVLSQLLPLLEGRRLVAAAAAVAQFEALATSMGGPLERGRWAHWLQQIEIIPDAVPGAADGQDAQHGDSRVATASGLTPRQRAAFGVGDALRALTLTANGRAVEALARQGVQLEVVVHRAMWLTGL